MLNNPLNLDRVVSLEGWEDENYNLIPQTKKWDDRVNELMKDAIHNENMVHPYTDVGLLEIMTYAYGLRGLSLCHVEHLRDLLSFPEPQERRKQYMTALRNRYKAKERTCLDHSGMTEEELNGQQVVSIEDKEMWENAKQIMNHVVREGINTFEPKTV